LTDLSQQPVAAQQQRTPHLSSVSYPALIANPFDNIYNIPDDHLLLPPLLPLLLAPLLPLPFVGGTGIGAAPTLRTAAGALPLVACRGVAGRSVAAPAPALLLLLLLAPPLLYISTLSMLSKSHVEFALLLPLRFAAPCESNASSLQQAQSREEGGAPRGGGGQHQQQQAVHGKPRRSTHP
jgi:hypothetical protein